ncbi:MAG: BlaI/MecI/CopY family transcriptional regulator [Peptococcaceae bacterium]|jgi:BlaI family penicillinase repressor|nr:BlaI/MecI/CopY family transcriptional regulator [Peptococcaceae bacterium]
MSIKIADAELEVMRILWREGRPLSYKEMRKELEVTRGWNKSTIQTLILRLRDKGFINGQHDDAADVIMHTPNISEHEYIQAEGQRFLDKLFDGNAKKFVTSLCNSGKLDVGDIDELIALLEKNKKK